MSLDININVICRCCTSEKGRMTSLFSKESLREKAVILSDLYTSCTSIQVKRDDGLPFQLCHKCKEWLKQSYMFQDTAVRSDKNLREKLSLVSKEKKPITIVQRFLEEGERDKVTKEVAKLGLKGNWEVSYPTIEIKGDLKNVPLLILPVRKENNENKEHISRTKVTAKAGGTTISFEKKPHMKMSLIPLQSDNAHITRKVSDKVKVCTALDHTYAKNQSSLRASTTVHVPNILPKEEGFVNKTVDAFVTKCTPNQLEIPNSHYQCGRCIEVFSDQVEYEEHVGEHGVLHKCNRCNKTFDSQVEFSEHMFYHTLEITEGEPDDLKPDSGKSRSTTHRKRIIKCNLCNKKCTSVYHIKAHMRVHKREKRPYMCHVCGKRFVQKPHLDTHLHTHKEIENLQEKKHKCSECSKSFLLPCHLRNHLRVHTGERPFKCHVCAKSFRLRILLNKHLPLHDAHRSKLNDKCDSQDKLHACDFCPETFITKLNVKNHIIFKHPSEYNPPIFNCPTCKREFHSKQNLKLHLLRHTANRPFTCSLCNRNFKDERTLLAHVKFHARPKPFECEVCHKRFIDRSALRVHFRRHTGERPFVCEVCNRGFSVKKSLVGHMRVHTGEKPYVCCECNSAFSRRSALLLHTLLVHNRDP